MSLYIARIQLHPSVGKSYDELHQFLQRWGATKYALDTQKRTWELPTGTYIVNPGADYSAAQVTNTLFIELEQAGFRSLVLVSKSQDTSFILPWNP